MDEVQVILRARDVVSRVGDSSIPVKLEPYLNYVGAILKSDKSLKSTEGGFSTKIKGKNVIIVNGNNSIERQRFTAFHEIAHFILNFPCKHESGEDFFASNKRPKSEIFCDIFASELLLPSGHLKPLADVAPMGFITIEEFSKQYQASMTAVGSRFAAIVSRPCAFVFIENGIVKYVSLSTIMKEEHVWIDINHPVPRNTLASEAPLSAERGPLEIDASIWFSNWTRGGSLFEEVRNLSVWNQTLSFLWFKEEEIPLTENSMFKNEDEEREELLKDLDGILPWSNKKHR